MKRSEIFFGALRVPVDISAAFLGFFAARELRLTDFDLFFLPPSADVAPEFGDFLPFAAAASVLLAVIFAVNRLYRLRTPVGAGEELRTISFLTTAWVLLIAAYLFVVHNPSFSRLLLGYTWVLTTTFVYLGRWIVRGLQIAWFQLSRDKRRVLIIGTNPDAIAIADELRHDARFTVAGHITIGAEEPAITTLGTIADVPRIAKEQSVEEIIVATSGLLPDVTRNLLNFCREEQIDFYLVPDLFDAARGNVDLVEIAGTPIIHLRPTPLTGWGRVVKRGFDLTIGMLALLGTLPIWIVTAIAIRLESPGPIFFSHYPDGKKVLRVGRGGRLFHFVKFRSMVVNDHTSRYTLPSHRAGPLVKITNDPRITRVGAKIRHYSIDELPNLLAVLKGDMSLVGPRAHLPEEVAKYAPHHRRVLSIKPGITGLPQVSGRSDLDFEREIELDTWYIENWSLWLDLKILWKTIAVVLFPKHKE